MSSKEKPKNDEDVKQGDNNEANLQKDKSAKLKKIVIGAVVLLVIIGGGAIGYFKFMAHSDDKTPAGGHSEHESSSGGGGGHGGAQASNNAGSIFLKMDDISVTLSGSSSKQNYLQASITLQLQKEKDSDVINQKLPLIVDSFQVFLRELRPMDLGGSAGITMLKIELLKRVNKIVYPVKVDDILFKELLMS